MEKGFNDFIGNMNIINENQQFIDNNINNDSKYEKIEIEEETNLFPLQKNISPPNQIILKKNKNKSSPTGELTFCEGRLLNDLAEFKRSKMIGKISQIKLYDYKKTENDCFELIIEFISYFSVKFIFEPDYPCSPPIIIYENGQKPEYVFDENGNVLIESIKKNNWSPIIWLSTLVYSIELLISSGTNNDINYSFNNDNNSNQNITNYFMKNKKQKYGKRKWDVYINDCKDYYNKENGLIPELEKNLKHLKIK
jgi:ubiquitin-protein ligase